MRRAGAQTCAVDRDWVGSFPHAWVTASGCQRARKWERRAETRAKRSPGTDFSSSLEKSCGARANLGVGRGTASADGHTEQRAPRRLRRDSWGSTGVVLCLGLLVICPYMNNAQYAFQVRFPPTENELNRPHVDCGTGQPRITEGACRSCTTECSDKNSPLCLCVNSFVIATTQVNIFNGMDEDVTVCTPTDTNGIELDLNDNDYRITIKTKTTTFNAPDGHVITLGSGNIECVRGQWNVEYVTTIAGQYIINIMLKTGETATGEEILIPLETAEKLSAPFQMLETMVRPGIPNPDKYFIDTVTSLRPKCSVSSIACRHCNSPELNGGCAGNNLVPAVQMLSQIIVYPGDRFSNPVEELCKKNVVTYNIFKALKIPSRQGVDCEGAAILQNIKCRGIENIARSVETWATLQTDASCSDEEQGVKPTEYYIRFTPTFSGFYSIEVQDSKVQVNSVLPVGLGPLVIPVEAAGVDADKTFAYGQGIFSVVQSELATFTIQPMDRFGNHHTNGIHVFQIEISQVLPPSAFRLTVDPQDSGKGTTTVEYQLQNAGTYEVHVRYCKDLLRYPYPPYAIGEPRVCNTGPDGPLGQYIQSSPFRVAIIQYEFYMPIMNVPGLMTQFRQAEVGVRYYALFTANFPVCGQKYGTPTVSQRYNPIVRFDLAAMRYSSVPRGTPTLRPSQVRVSDVDAGYFASTRYSEYAGRCYDDGYVFTFMITVSGNYMVWLYSDSSSPRAVAESPRTFVVKPDVQVIANFRGSGPVVECNRETDCMANQDTWLVVQAKDRFFNNATSCGEDIVVHVVPINMGSDHFTVSNLIEIDDVDGVAINGVAGPGITKTTRSGYIAEPISDSYGTLKSCVNGMYLVSVFATLSADYRVSVTVNNNTLEGSPFPLTIYPQQRQVVPGIVTLGLVTVTRWTYYRVYLDQPGIGFSVQVTKTDSNNGQPWTFMRFEGIFADIQEPDLTAGVRYEYPDARQSIYCRSCRIHVPPNRAKNGVYYISVYGYEDDSFHSILVSKYTDTFITPGSVRVGSLEPGRYAYYRFKITRTSGFQVRISTGNTQGSVTAVLKLGDYPSTDQDPSSIFGQALIQKNCQDCILDHPPSIHGRGNWYLAVMCHTYPVGIQVALLEFSETAIEFGSKSNQLSLQSLTWGYYTFTIDADIEPAGFKLDVIPTNAAFNLTTVLKKAQHPITLSDSTFKSNPCTHCRITVMTRQKLQGTWYVGVYAGATGGEFELKVKLLEACPNDCFGNGVCVQRKIKVCRCFPGYTGIDCREALKEKIFAWYPLDGHAADATANKRPLFYKVNADGVLSYQFDGLNLADSYIIIPKPTPAIVCSQFTKMAEPELQDLQWGAEQVTDEGTTDRNRVQEVVPEAGAWYQWNELGKSKGNPRTEQTCAEYNPRRELTIMFNFRVDERGLSPGSLMTLGKPSLIVGRQDADAKGKWSWALYPQNHPNGRHVIFDLYLRNLTHEISLREEEIYPIDGSSIFEKPDYWQRKFPNGWCIDHVRPVSKDGVCKYIEKKQYYHVAAVFGPRRVQLYVDATLVGVMKLDLWNITDTDGGRIQFGHDPRYAPFERLFFGQVRDIRILRYAASHEEISTLVGNGQTWFKWREAVRNSVGVTSNPGSWEDPIPLSGLDDGSLDPDLSAHSEICQSYRNPNEPRDMQFESNCPFLDTDTSWILKEGFDRYYRKHDTDRTPFGLGHEQMILLDTRPKQEVYLGRYYDFSIDEE